MGALAGRSARWKRGATARSLAPKTTPIGAVVEECAIELRFATAPARHHRKNVAEAVPRSQRVRVPRSKHPSLHLE